MEAETKPADDIAGAKPEHSIKKTSSLYGTQKQTVLLVDTGGHVTFVERTLFDDEVEPVAKTDRDRRFEFDVEG